MTADPRNDPVLVRFRRALDAAYGDRLERVVLYGSRARGDHRPDSDYDVAAFIRDMGTLWSELGTLSEITTDLLVEADADISAMPFPAGSYRQSSLFMREMSRDGRD